MRQWGMAAAFVILAAVAIAQAPTAKPAQAEAVMKAAYAKAKDAKKPLLVIFGATW